MSSLMILDERVAPASYTIDDAPDAAARAGQAIPLERWLELERAGENLSQTGLILTGASDLSPLEPLLESIPFIALSFPKFGDGRAYSHARRLRALWGYPGPLIAYGDVLRDQLHYMARCGINGFLLREDQDPHACLAAFNLFTKPYQYAPAADT